MATLSKAEYAYIRGLQEKGQPWLPELVRIMRAKYGIAEG